MGLSLFGGTGFVGSEFYKSYHGYTYPITRIPRYSRRAEVDTDILYMISTTHNYHVFDDPTLDVETNLKVLTETLRSWKNLNSSATFNFVSSWFVYGDVPMPVIEESPCDPRGFYSITKRAAEQLLISFAQTHNLNYRIMRLGNVLGRNDKGVSAKKNALQYLINKMKDGEKIDVYDGGLFRRNYIAVSDCVRAIKTVVDKGAYNTIYNVGTSRSYVFKDMLDTAAEKLGIPEDPYNFIPQKDFHKAVQVKDFTMDTSRLHRLGFHAECESEEELIDSIL